MGETAAPIKASVIIVTHNSAAWLGELFSSLRQQTPKVHEIVVIDNGSSDETVEWLSKQQDIHFFRQENVGFGAGCNRGAREASGDVLIFLNPDTTCASNAIFHLMEVVAKGVITTPQILLASKRDYIDTCGLDIHFTGLGFTRQHGTGSVAAGPPFEVPAFSGAAFAILRNDFLELEGFDEAIFLYGEDVELSWRARSIGYRVLCAPAAIIWHDHRLRLTAEKVTQLEASRRFIIRRHMPMRYRILASPSLLMMRAISWVAGARNVPRLESRRSAGAPGRMPALSFALPTLDGIGRGTRVLIPIVNLAFRINALLLLGIKKQVR